MIDEVVLFLPLFVLIFIFLVRFHLLLQMVDFVLLDEFLPQLELTVVLPVDQPDEGVLLDCSHVATFMLCG